MIHPTNATFPSGGATTAMFLGTLLIVYGKRWFYWVIGLSYILLISFSRLYLGVHFPLDVLGGWALAAIFLVLYFKLGEGIEAWLKKIGLEGALFVGLAVPASLMILFASKTVNFVMGAAIGIAIGSYFSLKKGLFLHKPKSWILGLSRSILSIVLLFSGYFLIPGADDFTKSLTIGLIMSLLVSPFCKWLTETKLRL